MSPKSRVAVLFTTPQTVLNDYYRLFSLAGGAEVQAARARADAASRWRFMTVPNVSARMEAGNAGLVTLRCGRGRGKRKPFPYARRGRVRLSFGNGYFAAGPGSSFSRTLSMPSSVMA